MKVVFVMGLSVMLSVPVRAQTTPPPRMTRMKIMPPESLHPRSLAANGLFGGDSAPGDTLTDEQILRRISRIYRYQSDLLLAQAEGDPERAGTLLDVAMSEMGSLLHQPDIMERPRFRELYRTVVTEHERLYGPADTLTMPYGDIFGLRADMFAQLNDVDEPLLEDVNPLKGLHPIKTTVPLTMNRLVESSLTYLRNNPDRNISHWLSRAETYFPMIEQIFAEEGVPDELKYLAMIESGLNPRARSWARAVGMWQFIAATGRAYGLHIDSWVDERRDPEKATRAAAKMLRALYEQYGDWHIALAGYNCSPRCIKRAQRRARARVGHEPNYWDMYRYLPRETRNYVPMFIATALAASNPSAFGLKASEPGPRYAYDYVPVHGALRLSVLAQLAGTDTAMLRALNPQLRRSSLPPSTEPFYLRIPVGSYEQFIEGYNHLPEDARLTAGEYVVRRGDTLGKIARKYGTSVTTLMRDNGLRRTTIRPGQSLVVPVPHYDKAPPIPALAKRQKVTIDYGLRTIRPLAASAAIARSLPPRTHIVKASAPAKPYVPKGATRISYKVRSGDTLGGIAEKYGTSASHIRSWNHIRGSRIRAGQRLTLYTKNSTPKATTSKSTAAAAKSQTGKITYKVRRGDTLGEIAQKYRVSIGNLRSWNNLRGSTIRAGQRLTIYPSSANSQTHLVRSGDTLSDIAGKYGVSIRDLKKWNRLRSNTIHPGQELTVRL